VVVVGCLVIGLTVVVTLLRWAVWRWLAVLAALPVACAGWLGDVDSGSAATAALAALAFAVPAWRARPGPRTWMAAVVLALLTVTVFWVWWDEPRRLGTESWGALLPGLALALGAVAGLGRADGSPARLPCLLWVLGPAVVLVACDGEGLICLAWWPAAGALGLTALLRGRRGKSTGRPQVDDVDREALGRFADGLEGRLAPVVVVIAAYDEAAALPGVLARMPDTVCGLPLDVVVVDDGSPDGTAEAARGTGRAHVVECRANRGQGAALRLGYRIAREHGAAYVATTDADGQYDVADLPAILEPILDDRADFVTGSRRLGVQHSRDAVRQVGTYLFAWLTSALVGQHVTDTSFGLRGMRSEVTAAVTLNQPQYQSSELLIGAISHGFRVLEVPATMHARSAGSSKKGGNLAYGLRYARVVIGTWWREGCPAPMADRAPALGVSRVRRMPWRDHWPFLVLLGLGGALRVVVQLSFPPAFVYSDGPGYLGLVDHLTPSSYRVVGYGFFLRTLAWAERDVWLVAVAQHLLGLATAVLAYILLRRWGAGRWPAALATVPVLFDGMQLVLEHSVLSDVLFDLIVLAGVGALAWHPRPRVPTTVLGGLLLGAAVCVRLVGQPLVVAAVAFCLLAATTWRARLVHVVVVTAAFCVPVVGYAAWYHHEHDAWALSDSGGRALYMRTTAWVDCSRFTMPDYERPLCPAEPLGHRLDPTEYGWHTPDASHGLTPPAGVTVNEAMHDFAVRALKAQPGDYARTVLRDVAYGFQATRGDDYEYDTADKWSFARYVDLEQLTRHTRPAYEAHGGELPTVRQPGASKLATYGTKVYLWGPALLALWLVALAGLFLPGEARGGRRSVLALLLLVGGGLVVTPDVTAEFVWRYQLPGVVLVPMAAALGWARLRARGHDGTDATPSTDWPNGGRTLRSKNRVVGTSQRS
jgi:hypothetical protein